MRLPFLARFSRRMQDARFTGKTYSPVPVEVDVGVPEVLGTLK